MTITEEKLAKLDQLYREVDELSEKASDAIKNAKRNKENEITIARDGKPIIIKEALLWDEVRVLGTQAIDAYSVLSEKYPEPFELSKQQIAKANEMDMFVLAEFGISSTQIRLKDIMTIVEAMVDYKLKTKVL
jgi:dsDNA-specific endonuclease/ATPase MutS2